MNVLIDPYMFGMEDLEEIEGVIPFFQMVIHLCSSGKLHLFIYKEFLEGLRNRGDVPFPILLGKIANEKKREAIKSLNDNFANTIARYISTVDIEQCDGDQDFSVESDDSKVQEILSSDNNYYELLCILLSSCYRYDDPIASTILTGEGPVLKVGDTFSLACKCSSKSFTQRCEFVSIEKFETSEDKAYLWLYEKALKGELTFVDSPEIVRGDHHNKLQNDSEFTTFEGLSRKNKRVLSILRYFGLKRITFGEFHHAEKRPVSTIYIVGNRETDAYDIVEGWLIAETGYKNHVDLYFPKGVGNSLKEYFGAAFEQNEIERLKGLLAL